MKIAAVVVCGMVGLTGCVAVAPTPPVRQAAAETPRERFTFPSSATRATLAYSCRPGAQGGGTEARAQAAHASFDAALAGFAASQASAATAAINRGLTGAALSAELSAAGDAFAAEQRARLDGQYGCVPAGEA
jgi:ribosomal protein S9